MLGLVFVLVRVILHSLRINFSFTRWSVSKIRDIDQLGHHQKGFTY
jgi:hypothetical protein